MNETHRHIIYLFYVLTAALGVYVFAHWDAIKSPYVINDDVRQQIYWMRQWQDKELFQDHILTQYAKNYVPWGVKAIYWAAARMMDPVQFTKVLTGVLFVITAALVFGLVLQIQDDLTAILAVCVFFFFGHFMKKISGGLSQSFAYPLLLGYLFFLVRNRLFGAGVMIFLQSLFNPYIFLLSLVTHVISVFHNQKSTIVSRLSRNYLLYALFKIETPKNLEPTEKGTEPAATPKVPSESKKYPVNYPKVLLDSLPVGTGILLMALRYVFFKPPFFGELVSRADMTGNLEYTIAGRYEIIPVPSVLSEIIRVWSFNLPFKEWGPLGGGISLGFLVCIVVFAFMKRKSYFDLSDFKVFIYLMISSILLFVLSNLFLFKLFLPRRYFEFSANIFFCVGTAVFIRIAIQELGLMRIAFPFLVSLFVILGALRLHNVGIYDYSNNVAFYRFLEKTPKDSLIAGHPSLMDNVGTFSCRKAFVTYELSHTWIKPYWTLIKARTFDFFSAYYSSKPEKIREFCRINGIDYLVVRDEDFKMAPLMEGKIYFEPFGSYIRAVCSSKTNFAALDEQQFPPVYQKNGIRVIKFD